MNIRVFIGKKEVSLCFIRVALFMSLVKKEVTLTEPLFIFYNAKRGSRVGVCGRKICLVHISKELDMAMEDRVF
jgi:hypothetical protein